MKFDPTLHAADLRLAVSDLEGFTEGDKVLLGCWMIPDSLEEIPARPRRGYPSGELG